MARRTGFLRAIFRTYSEKECGSWGGRKKLWLMLRACHPRWGHFQPGRVGANWCRYGERNDETKRHDEGGEAVVSRSGALYRGARLRAGRRNPSKQRISSKNHEPQAGEVTRSSFAALSLDKLASCAMALRFRRHSFACTRAPAPKLRTVPLPGPTVLLHTAQMLCRTRRSVIAGPLPSAGKLPIARESDGMEPSAASNPDKPFAGCNPSVPHTTAVKSLPLDSASPWSQLP